MCLKADMEHRKVSPNVLDVERIKLNTFKMENGSSLRDLITISLQISAFKKLSVEQVQNKELL